MNDFIESLIKTILGHPAIKYADSMISLNAARTGTTGWEGETLDVPIRKALHEAFEQGKKERLN